ncbi:hypothetical protein [Salisediminibacterium beveridgei]|uniref:Uncharacterized protein n=1 Tax=Salisediminibacterium beveridgei TaxID=632773 RepID=A0A1D7QZK8_9BACI|nr:hypothetical protein [Salisediminibacterium beveridgei]AOM84438.1 hypothetical protein BBEV_3121 [Salisediminibacterium beveridgei]
MNGKKRVMLGAALYLLFCFFDYVIHASIDWIWNLVAAGIGMMIGWVVIEVLPRVTNNNQKV